MHVICNVAAVQMGNVVATIVVSLQYKQQNVLDVVVFKRSVEEKFVHKLLESVKFVLKTHVVHVVLHVTKKKIS